MSTLNGLSRYDGTSFVTYRPESGNQLSICDHRIKELDEDKNGFLWIATTPELFSCYDLKRGNFVDYTGCGEWKQNYAKKRIMSNGDVWLWHDSNGCRKVTYSDGHFASTVFKVERGNLPANGVNFVAEGNRGEVWIGTTKGLVRVEGKETYVVDKQHNFFNAVVYDGQTYFVSTDNQIFQRSQAGGIHRVASLPSAAGLRLTASFQLQHDWLLFTTGGVYVFNMHTGQLTQSDWLTMKNGLVTDDNRGNLWVYNRTGNVWYVNAQTRAIKMFTLLSADKIGHIDMERYHIVQDSRDIIWISTYGNGLFAYDSATDELQHFTSNINGFSHISSNFLQYIIEDRSGGIWVSSEFSGVSHLEVINKGAYRIYPEDQALSDRSNTVRMITQMRNGDLWVGTRTGGLYVYDTNLRFTGKKSFFHSNIYAVNEDAKGTVWLGSRGDGLCIGDRWYQSSLSDPASLSSNHIFCLYPDAKKRMWVGTFGGGLDLAVEEKGTVRFRHFLNKSYSQRQIRVLQEDNNGMMWVGTSSGVYIFHPDSLIRHPDKYWECNYDNGLLRNNEIKCMLRDSQGRMWVGTSGSGFSVCTPGKDYGKLKFEHFDVKDGLVNGMVQSIAEDKNGKFWISTEYGISSFSLEQRLFESYFFSTYTLGNVYSENSVCALDDGKLLFGTNHGLMVVDPDRVVRSEKTFPVAFTGLSINGISVRPDDVDSPLTSAITYTDHIELNHWQNSFAVDFSTFDYANSGSVKYSYQLVNYDKEWSIPSSLNFAGYKNLPPGNYTLRVKSCNSAGLWSDDEAVLSIIITPPYWKTGWAFLLYAVLLVVVLYFTFNIIRNFNGLRNRIQIERQLTEYKLVFFTNISHEFRTPLTLIQGALEKLYRENNVPKEMQHPLKTMEKSTNRMLRLINQLLEFRKMQNNKLTLSLEETDVVAFLYEIFLSFEDAAESKQMQFAFRPSVASYRMFIDKGNLDKVTYNLLSNAFKYTPSGGRVTFSVAVDEARQVLRIEVADTGVGIPKEKRSELFNRFMQSSFSGSSVGVGLHLTHELVNVHKGTIAYAENEGSGSVFTVTLPLDKHAYQPTDFLIANNILLAEEQQQKEKWIEATTGGVQPAVPLNQRKVLIIEDDNDVRDFLKEEIGKYFEVVAEADGTSGFERAQSYDADLIICDVLMPGMTGYEVTRKLKSEFSTSHIPVILLTAMGLPENHLEGIESGADAYITKPFSPALLLARAFKLIEQRDKLRDKFSNEPGVVLPAICTTHRDKEFVDQLHTVLEQHLADADFSVDEFASLMKLGRTVFYKKVRGLTGYSPNEYIRIIRMKKAAELLLDNRLTIAEVSYKVGINDPFYFSKCFKAQFGMAPSVYQRGEKEVEI